MFHRGNRFRRSDMSDNDWRLFSNCRSHLPATADLSTSESSGLYILLKETFRTKNEVFFCPSIFAIVASCFFSLHLTDSPYLVKELGVISAPTPAPSGLESNALRRLPPELNEIRYTTLRMFRVVGIKKNRQKTVECS